MSDFDFSTLITDRTNSDVSALSELLAKDITEWTPEELDRFNNGLFKGAYWWTDLNRVTACMSYIDKELKKIGYSSGYAPVVVHKVDAPFRDENTILLLHGEDLTDSSLFKNPVSNNGVQASASQSKFGEKSLYFNGANSLSVSLPVSGDMTVDFWVYLLESQVMYPSPFNWVAGSHRGPFIHMAADQTYHGATDNAGVQITGTFSAIGKNSWNHIAVVRTGSEQKCFLNGSLVNTITGVNTENTIIYLGFIYEAQDVTKFTGYVDEFRVSNVPRWVSNFSPPEAPYVVEYNPEPGPELDPYTWYKEDAQTLKQMELHLLNLKKIRAVLKVAEGTPGVPDSIKKLTFKKANDIEKILLAIEKEISNIKKTVNLGWVLGVADVGLYGGV